MLSCSIESHLLFTEVAVYNYRLIPTKRGGVVFSLSLSVYSKWHDVPWNVNRLHDLWSTVLLACQHFRTCWAQDPWCCSSLYNTHKVGPPQPVYTADFSTSLQVPGEFQANSMMLLNSILFEIPRDVVWCEVRLCQAGVCKWETGDRSRGEGSILPLSCGLAPPRAFLPILSPAFILITTCIISCQLLTPANRKGCPQRPCFFCILFSIYSYCVRVCVCLLATILFLLLLLLLMVTLLFNTISEEHGLNHVWLLIIRSFRE